MFWHQFLPSRCWPEKNCIRHPSPIHQAAATGAVAPAGAVRIQGKSAPKENQAPKEYLGIGGTIVRSGSFIFGLALFVMVT